MQERSIDGALLALRKVTIRENRDGLEHIETLLRMRGVSMPCVFDGKRPDAARAGHMRRWIIEALRDGPKRLPELAAIIAVHTPAVPHERVYKRTSVVLTKMKRIGIVEREGRLWRLAP